jgi:XRE family transcriptional regulator, regulator of sulfur utilization
MTRRAGSISETPWPKKTAGRSLAEKSRPLEQHVGEAIRRLRDSQRLSVRTLASKCGFSPSFISQVELNQASPSLASLERIAQGLGVTIGQLFEALEPVAPALVRSSQRPMLQSEWSRSQIESLGAGKLDALLITMRPGGTSGGRLHSRETELFVLVVAGVVRLVMEDDAHVLKRGDAITIPPGTAHRWENTGARAVQLLKVVARS